jgi:hypothetical protein
LNKKQVLKFLITSVVVHVTFIVIFIWLYSRIDYFSLIAFLVQTLSRLVMVLGRRISLQNFFSNLRLFLSYKPWDRSFTSELQNQRRQMRKKLGDTKHLDGWAMFLLDKIWHLEPGILFLMWLIYGHFLKLNFEKFSRFYFHFVFGITIEEVMLFDDEEFELWLLYWERERKLQDSGDYITWVCRQMFYFYILFKYKK